MEKERSGTICVRPTDITISVVTEEGSMPFTFDRVFGMDTKQRDIFEDTALPLIADVLDGYNATIFA